MKTIIYTVVIFLSGAICSKTNAQGRLLKDTVYYLVDTAKTPVNDRMISVYKESRLICFEINCPCLKDGQNPVLRYNIKERETRLTLIDFKKIKLITLPVLINDIKEIVSNGYKERYVINIIEPEGDYFKMHLAGVAELKIKSVTDTNCCDVKKP